MNRLEEINRKHEQIRALLDESQKDRLHIQQTNNIAWFSAGADASIPANSETGVYSILVDRQRRTIVANTIEITRLRAEENFEALGFDYQISDWYAETPLDLPNLISDHPNQAGPAVQRLRWILCEGEIERYRALGRDCADALEEAARAVSPGDTEFDLAARLDAACRRRGGLAIVNLVATDERISRFRHPLPTMKKLEKVAMLVVCMRRGGLIAAATRFAHIGALPAELEAKMRKAAAIDAAAIAASSPGRTLGDVFADLQAAYAAQNESDQWKLHHQGGLIAYRGRERIATPNDPTPIQDHQALAWNPSIVGAKSEDTILLDGTAFEIITSGTGGWPMIDIDTAGKRISRPWIVEI